VHLLLKQGNIMSVLVRIPTPLQKLAGDKAELHVEATTLRQVVEQLASQNDEFKARLLDDSGNLRRFVNVYVNEEDVRFLQKLDTPLKDGDEVSIVPAIAGGSAVATKASVLVRVPTPLHPLVGGRSEFQATASSLRELIENLSAENPEFGQRVLSKQGEINRFLNVFLNDEDVRYLQKLDTPFEDGDEVAFIPQISGG